MTPEKIPFPRSSLPGFNPGNDDELLRRNLPNFRRSSSITDLLSNTPCCVASGMTALHGLGPQHSKAVISERAALDRFAGRGEPNARPFRLRGRKENNAVGFKCPLYEFHGAQSTTMSFRSVECVFVKLGFHSQLSIRPAQCSLGHSYLCWCDHISV